MKFSKGFTYLIRRKGRCWYIIHQISQRGWTATLFSHVSQEMYENERTFTSNGVQLWEQLGVEESHQFSSSAQAGMRQMMMSILKYGDPSRKNEV